MVSDMAGSQEEKAQWISRVLGVAVPASQDPGAGGEAVAYRKALLEFARAKTDASAQLDRLVSAVNGQLPEEAELVQRVAGQLQALNERISATVDAALNSSGRSDGTVRREIEAYLTQLSADPLVGHVDDNPFVFVSIGKTLTAALRAVLAAV